MTEAQQCNGRDICIALGPVDVWNVCCSVSVVRRSRRHCALLQPVLTFPMMTTVLLTVYWRH